MVARHALAFSLSSYSRVFMVVGIGVLAVYITRHDNDLDAG
jgi:hypothetical protein